MTPWSVQQERRRARWAPLAGALAVGVSVLSVSALTQYVLPPLDGARAVDTELREVLPAATTSGFTFGDTFVATYAGWAAGLAVYVPGATTVQQDQAQVTLWDAAGAVVAKGTLAEKSGPWRMARFPSAIPLQREATYTLGVWSPYWDLAAITALTTTRAPLAAGIAQVTGVAGSGDGRPQTLFSSLSLPNNLQRSPLPVGSVIWGAAPPGTPTPTPTATAFPNASNTGVPAGTALSAYTGPSTITTAGTVIDGKVVNGSLVIAAKDVVIKRSQVNGRIDSDSANASVSVIDSEVNAGVSEAAAIGFRNLTVLRTEIRGGAYSVTCAGNCLVQDSWLHSQSLPAGADWHINAFLSNGGSGMTLKHNTLHCTTPDNAAGGGCSTNASFFGDFAPITNVTVTDNLFKATTAGYCATFGYNPGKPYGTASSNISVTNNVFERGGGKCGYWGPVTGYAPSGASTFTGNTWSDGGTVLPAS